MKTGSILLTLILLAALAGNAQPVIRKAQKKMNLFNYSRAIELLQKAVEKPGYREAAIPLLAECYRMQHDVEASRSWYEQAVTLPNPKPEWFFYYASALQANGEYSRAADFYSKYAEQNPSDLKSKVYIKQCELLMGEWKNIPPKYEVRSIQGINSKESDFGPALYANGFTFTSDRGYIDMDDDTYGWTGRKYLNIFFAKPKVSGEFFGEYREPYPMQGRFNQSFHDGPVNFAGDSLAMFTRSFREKKAQRTGKIRTDYLKIYSSKRVRGDWQELQPFFLNSYDYSVGHPALTSDGKTLVFASDMPGGQGGVDLWKCIKTSEGWSTPVNLGPTVNSGGDEMFPSFKADGTLYFASDGLPGYGGLDIFSTYESKGAFHSPENIMAPINSSYDDFAITWVPGTTYGMFSSNRPGGLGLDDIYAFKKLKGAPEEEKVVEKEELAVETKMEKQEEIAVEKLPEPDILIWGLVKDKDTRLPLEGAIVFILNERNDSVYIVITDKEGIYRANIKPASSLIIKATEKGWVPDCLGWRTDALIAGQDNKASRDLLLSKLQVNKTFTLENIYYDFDKSDIRPDAEPSLDKLISLMKENPITIELLSHTDCRGSFAYNDKLSLRRAESAANYLKSNGINSSRIQTRGFGEKQLSNKCADGVKCSEDEHQANRRTEFRVTDTGKFVPDDKQFDPLKFKSKNVIQREELPADFFMQCGN
jgi:outer membrane protein OmpA-like peptidoglycan-associated protein/tetratricopeptide (TPR) repeat protein